MHAGRSASRDERRRPAEGTSETYVCPRRSTAPIACWFAACGARSPPARSRSTSTPITARKDAKAPAAADSAGRRRQLVVFDLTGRPPQGSLGRTPTGQRGRRADGVNQAILAQQLDVAGRSRAPAAARQPGRIAARPASGMPLHPAGRRLPAGHHGAAQQARA